MNIEDVSREGFSSRRTAQQQRDFTIGTRVLGEIVVHDQYIAAGFHEVLRDTRGRVGSDVRQPGGVASLAHHDDGVGHCTVGAQIRPRLCYGGGTLAHGNVNTDDVVVALVEDGVDGNCG